jgi:hypothetical protein
MQISKNKSGNILLIKSYINTKFPGGKDIHEINQYYGGVEKVLSGP